MGRRLQGCQAFQERTGRSLEERHTAMASEPSQEGEKRKVEEAGTTSSKGRRAVVEGKHRRQEALPALGLR